MSYFDYELGEYDRRSGPMKTALADIKKELDKLDINQKNWASNFKVMKSNFEIIKKCKFKSGS